LDATESALHCLFLQSELGLKECDENIGMKTGGAHGIEYGNSWDEDRDTLPYTCGHLGTWDGKGDTMNSLDIELHE
jgi:hypothetical protein